MTDRDAGIVEMYRSGMTFRQIGPKVGLDQSTVAHMARALMNRDEYFSLQHAIRIRTCRSNQKSRRRSCTHERDDTIVSMYRAGSSVSDVCEKIKLSPSVVGVILRRKIPRAEYVELRRESVSKQRLAFIASIHPEKQSVDAEIVRLRREGFAIIEIAKLVKCRTSSVNNRLAKLLSVEERKEIASRNKTAAQIRSYRHSDPVGPEYEAIKRMVREESMRTIANKPHHGEREPVVYRSIR